MDKDRYSELTDYMESSSTHLALVTNSESSNNGNVKEVILPEENFQELVSALLEKGRLDISTLDGNIELLDASQLSSALNIENNSQDIKSDLNFAEVQSLFDLSDTISLKSRANTHTYQLGEELKFVSTEMDGKIWRPKMALVYA